MNLSDILPQELRDQFPVLCSIADRLPSADELNQLDADELIGLGVVLYTYAARLISAGTRGEVGLWQSI